MTGPIHEPVTLARRLKAYGLSLREAHQILEQIVRGQSVDAVLYTFDSAGIPADFAQLGVAAQVVAASPGRPVKVATPS